MEMDRLLQETPLLDYSGPSLQDLTENRRWKSLPEKERVRQVYDFVRNEILFGYNADDAIPASRVLSDGYGQCNTKGILFMALLRGCGIPCRVHCFAITKELQKGAMTGLVYRKAPERILHSWVEVWLEGTWYELEGFILDESYLEGLWQKFPDRTGRFVGYGVGTADFRHPQIDFAGNNTYIQKEGIVEDFGTYDSPDEMLQEHRQQMSAPKRLAYQHLGRHLMNRNIQRIRESGENR